MGELGKLGTPKAEKAALHWFIKGALELPEDEEKLKQALSLAEKFKLDPLQFDSPMALFEEADRRNTKKQKLAYVDPDTVPELTNKRDLGGGLVIYDVEDSETSRDALDAEEAIQKLVDLAKTAIEKEFSIVYTNEFSDKSQTKRGGRSQEQYAEIWNEAMRQITDEVGAKNASIAYVRRGIKDAADIVIVVGKASSILEEAIKKARRDENSRTQTANRSTASDTPTVANPGAEVKPQ